MTDRGIRTWNREKTDVVIRNTFEPRNFLGIVVYGAGTWGWQLITINFVGGLFMRETSVHGTSEEESARF